MEHTKLQLQQIIQQSKIGNTTTDLTKHYLTMSAEVRI